MFFPRERQSRYTYSTREDGAPGFGDHWDPDTHWPDAWCLISAMAAVTEHIEFTTGVYIAPARDLITVAKQVGTAAVLSSGRVALGVGVGWCEEEFVATGQDFHTRGKRLDDMIPALRALWAGGWVEYHGPHYDVPAMRMEPSPPRPIPIIGGGHSAPGAAPGRDVVRRVGGGGRLQARPGAGSTSARWPRSAAGPGARTSRSRSTCRCGPGPMPTCTGASRRSSA